MTHRIYLSIIGILAIVILLKQGCNCGRPAKTVEVAKVDTIELWRTDTIIEDRPVPYRVEVAKTIFRDTGLVLIDSVGYFIVPDSLTDDLITDYFSFKFYDITVRGDGYTIRRKDTVFMNQLTGWGMDVSIRERIVERTTQLPPRREGYAGLTAAYWPGTVVIGPQISYKDRGGRIFTGAVMAGPNGLIYQVGAGIKISLTKKR